MAAQYDFSMHVLAQAAAQLGDVDPTLAMMGTQGWEIRGLTALADGSVLVALQRAHGTEAPLPDAPELSAALAEPLSAPSAEEFAALTEPPSVPAGGP
jgi:hypothetical protein